LKETDKPNENQ
jgi:hypothetical protein